MTQEKRQTSFHFHFQPFIEVILWCVHYITLFYLAISNMTQHHVAFCERHVALHERHVALCVRHAL